jgi:DHA1 family bicyclomycin/chloramphenicol resistance-like MFS transporter
MTEHKLKARLGKLALLLGSLTALGPLSIDMYLPAFPYISRELRTPEGMVQLTLSIFLFTSGICQVIYGPLIDRFGRKRPLLIGCALFILGSVGCAYAQTIEMLIAMRLLQALGSAAGLVVSRAVVRDLFDAQEGAKMFSHLMLVMGVAPIVAPWLGGQFLKFSSWHTIFVFLAVFGIICLLASIYFLPETLDREQRVKGGLNQIFKNFVTLLKHRQFLGYVLITSFNSGILFSYISGSPFVFMEIYGLSAQEYGYFFGLNAFGLIGAAQINRFLLIRFSPEKIISSTVLVTALAGCILLLCSIFHYAGFGLLFALLFICLFGIGLSFPNLSAISLQPFGQLAGSASALLGMTQFLIGGTAGALIGAFHNNTALPMSSLIAFFAASAVLILFLLNFTNHEKKS